MCVIYGMVESMETRKLNYFKDDIKKTFTLYALIPVIIITFFSYIISFSLWYSTVMDQNKSTNAKVSGRIQSIMSSYMAKADKMANQDTLINAITTHKASVELYEEFYNFVNSMDIRCNFFVFDASMEPIVASSTLRPQYTQMDSSFSWGITRRMQETPTEAVLGLVPSEDPNKRVLTVGKAILRDGKILGYLTFDFDQATLAGLISQNFSINVVVTDQFGYVVSSTNALLVNKFGKIDTAIRDKSGFVKTSEDSLYVTRTQLSNGNAGIYTLTSIGYFGSIFILVGLLLILLFGVLTLTMFWAAKKIADRKTRVIDDIIEAIGNIQNGNLDVLLNINTNDEFQIIAESYNQMLTDIKNLIETNKEKARQSVLSEIKQLESQFNPHFLFNTLETIKYMSIMDPPSVRKIIVALSTLLRYSINNTISSVTLADDLEYTKNYLLIQKYRFGERFDYTVFTEPGTLECIVPKLIVQPLLENSIKYGFENRKSLLVKIKASFVEDNLIIVIYDDGVGMEQKQLEEIRSIITHNKNNSAHIGLFNVHRRVQLMYGEKYGIEILSQKDSGTVVKIILPIHKKEDNHAENSHS